MLAAILLASTSLHITVWPNGQGHAPVRTYTLTCAPLGLMTFRALALVGMTGLTLAASACGGSSGANGSGSSSASDLLDPVAWSACMRSHGVPTFPDPDSSGRIQIPSSIDDRLPTVRAAYRACRNLAPSESSLTGQGDTLQQDRLLAFAKCMRSHGVPNFPDRRS
jgi:hypothetical protein